MSNRALRKLHGEDEIQKLAENDVKTESSADEQDEGEKLVKKNAFALLGADNDDDSSKDEKSDANEAAAVAVSVPSKSGHKKKNKKKKKKTGGDAGKPKKTEENLDELIDKFNAMHPESPIKFEGAECSASEVSRTLLCVEYRHLQAENELSRLFGSSVLAGTRQRRKPNSVRSHCLVRLKENWPIPKKTGLSMECFKSQNNLHYLKFDHSTAYAQIQRLFFLAAESHNPQNLTAILRNNPYHVDTLLQLSEVFHMNEDYQDAADLIDRALYVFQMSFHSKFSITAGNCRLPYKYKENRGFYLCLFHRITYLGRRGCYRTALEHCKILLSMDPELDPLAILLAIDYYSLRSGEYQYLVDFYEQFDPRRNLSQLPNYAFSVPLAMFYLSRKSKKEDESKSNKASTMLQNSLLMFPGVLMPLLNKCNIQPDKEVEDCLFFGHLTRALECPGLNSLQKLYVEQCFPCWKDPDVIFWLETNVKVVLKRVLDREPLRDTYDDYRKARYCSPPKNIYRHILLSRLDGVISTLPPAFSADSLLSYDPLPPTNSVASYRMESESPLPNEHPLALLFRSLLPSFNVQQEQRNQAGNQAGVGRAGDVAGAAAAEPTAAAGPTAAAQPMNRIQDRAVVVIQALRNLLREIEPAPVERDQLQQLEQDMDPEFDEDGWEEH